MQMTLLWNVCAVLICVFEVAQSLNLCQSLCNKRAITWKSYIVWYFTAMSSSCQVFTIHYSLSICHITAVGDWCEIKTFSISVWFTFSVLISSTFIITYVLTISMLDVCISKLTYSTYITLWTCTSVSDDAWTHCLNYNMVGNKYKTFTSVY